MLCLKWVPAVRILALSSLALHIGIILTHTNKHIFILPITAIIHLAVFFVLLKECQELV